MLYRYYYKRLQLFKIPYKVLLAYHSPLGNPIRLWTSVYMNSFILAVRKDIYVLNIAYTIIQIRKALNTIFQKTRYRGALMIYAQARLAIKIKANIVFSFVTEWVPGLLTNYKRVVNSIQAYTRYRTKYKHFLKRSQVNATTTVNLRSLPTTSEILRRRKLTYLPKIPSVSLSILDSYIWLSECFWLGIPSIQLCDTQSIFEKVTYPIITNQRSTPFSYLLVHLCTEVANTSLLNPHLEFLSFFKYHSINRFPTNKKRSRIKLKKIRTMRRFQRPLFFTLRYGYISQEFNRNLLKFIKRSYPKRKRHDKKIVIKRSWFRRKRQKKKIVKRLIPNKPSFILNKKFFTYQIKDLIKTRTIIKNPVKKRYYLLMCRLIRKDLLRLKQIYNRMEKKIKRTRRKRRFFKRNRMKIKSTRKFYQRYLVAILGLKKALSRKRKQKRRYLTMISLKKRDLKHQFVCSFMHTFSLKKNFIIKSIKNRHY